MNLLPLLCVCVGANAVAPKAIELTGHYVEARSASVFAGACHAGGESTTAGREALLAWHFESGARAGVELAGLDLAVVIAGEENLAERGTARASVIYVSDKASPVQREALVSLVKERYAAVIGDVRSVEYVGISASFGEHGSYHVASAGRFDLEGSTLADRACCKMPFHVWYKPFADVNTPIVGCNTNFKLQEPRLSTHISRPGENAAFTGAFALPATLRAP